MNLTRGLDSKDLPAFVASRLRQRVRRYDPHSFVPELSYGRHFAPPPADARRAAVLVLLYRAEDEWRVPLMLRPDHMLAHASQVSFPGGVVEGNETLEECAVREFAEELGAATSSLELLGRLSPVYIFGSNFHVTPCVAVAREPLTFSPNPIEVEKLLELPLTRLLDPEARQTHTRQRRGVIYQSPHFEFQQQQIWGATCLMLGELQNILQASSAARPSGCVE